MFTAPDDLAGTYSFYTQVCNDDKMALSVVLVKNDDILCSCQEQNMSDSDDGTASCSAIVELNAG